MFNSFEGEGRGKGKGVILDIFIFSGVVNVFLQ